MIGKTIFHYKILEKLGEGDTSGIFITHTVKRKHNNP